MSAVSQPISGAAVAAVNTSGDAKVAPKSRFVRFSAVLAKLQQSGIQSVIKDKVARIAIDHCFGIPKKEELDALRALCVGKAERIIYQVNSKQRIGLELLLKSTADLKEDIAVKAGTSFALD